MTHEKRRLAAELLAYSMVVGQIAGGPYGEIPMGFPKIKHHRGSLVVCSYCGRGGRDVQLFNDGNKKLNGEKVKICQKCKQKREEEGE